jgi:hypothetical protein
MLTLLHNTVFALKPAWSETLYGEGLFPLIRTVFRYTLGLLSFPAVTAVAVVALVLFILTCIRPLIRRQWTLWTLIAGFLSTMCAVLFLFQLLWGFNYSRMDLAQRMRLETQGMTREDLQAEFVRATAALKTAAYEISSVVALNSWTNRDYEDAIKPVLRRILAEIGYPEVASPRGRIIGPKGMLMRWNTAGIYVPFSGEGHVDAGMLPVQIPFTLAHEMAHGFGVTDEGDCNFLGYLVCIQSDDPLVRFSGVLTYWRYLASEYRHAFPDAYAKQYETLPALVRETLAAIRMNDALYPDLFPKLRNAVYDSYLKSQGIAEGLRSYNRIVQLVWAYENAIRNAPHVPAKN